MGITSTAFLLALAAAIAFLGFHQAQKAEVAAEEAARRATHARDEAEKLIEFMTFDLIDKLESIGRLSLLNDVNKTVQAYYDSFAGEEESTDVSRRRMVRFKLQGDVLRAEGNLVAALRGCLKSSRLS